MRVSVSILEGKTLLWLVKLVDAFLSCHEMVVRRMFLLSLGVFRRLNRCGLSLDLASSSVLRAKS